MLVSTSHKFAFLHPPKTGGSSITEALAPFLDDPKEADPLDRRGWQFKHHADRQMHSTWTDNEKFLKERPHWTIAGFVRNPWCRMTSLYQFLANGGETFGAFVQRFHDHPGSIRGHWPAITAREWLGRANFIGRFERLEEEFRRLCHAVGIDPPELPMRRAKKPKPPMIEFYREWPETIPLVDAVWPGDAEAYGYEPPHV